MQRIAEAVSLFTVFQNVAAAGLVVYLLGPTVLHNVRNKNWEPYDIFMFAVVISFIYQISDNSYWELPWSLKYIDHPDAGVWVDRGVYPNIPVRNIGGTVAALLHVMAVVLGTKDERLKARRKKVVLVVMGLSFVAGSLFMVWLEFLR